MLDKEALMSQRGVAVGVPAVEHEYHWALTHDAVFNRSPLRLLRVVAYDIVPQDKVGRRPPRIVERKRDMVQWRKAICSPHTLWSAGKPGRQVPVLLCARR